MHFTKRFTRFLALASIMLFSGLMAGCGKPPAEKAEQRVANGNAALAAGDPAKAVREFKEAIDDAEKAKRKDPSFDVAPYHAHLQRGRDACSEKARRLLDEAKTLARTNPEAAMDRLAEANELADPRYGNNAGIIAESTTIASSQDLAPAMARRQMDEYTRAINHWLFMRDANGDLPSYWDHRAYHDMLAVKARLETTLRNWQAAPPTALTQLIGLGAAFDAWRLSAVIDPYSRAQGFLLMEVMRQHASLKATLGGRESINYWLLEQNWGIRQSGTGNGYDWVGHGPGTGNGGTGTGNGGTGTGNGGTGTGTGGTGTGTGGTGTGTGTMGTGTGNGGGSTGTGTGTGTGTRSTGTGDGRRSTGTGTGTGGSDPFGGLERTGTGTGTGGGSRSTGTGTGTGNGTR